jgi:GntR family transcriptional regulator of gluconate operon
MPGQQPWNAPRLAPLRSSSLADQVYEALRSSILAGRFEPGEKLVESRLASDLGVSRGPIRDALRQLAEDSLVVERPRSGAFVRELRAPDLVEIYNVRLAIELLAMRLCVRGRASTEPLRALIDTMAAAARAGDREAVVDAEMRFHSTLCELADNTQLTRMFRRLEGPMHLALAMDDASYENLKEIADEHLPLVRAIEAGDEAVAVAELHEHVMCSIGELVHRLGGDASQLVPPLTAAAPGAGGPE